MAHSPELTLALVRRVQPWLFTMPQLAALTELLVEIGLPRGGPSG